MIIGSCEVDVLREPMPDWQDASAYEYIHSLSWSSIAWEFLRRNQGYVHDFFEYVEKAQTYGQAASRSDYQAICQKYGLNELAGLMNPPLLASPNFAVPNGPMRILASWYVYGSGMFSTMRLSEMPPDYPAIDVRISLDESLEDQVRRLRKKYNSARRILGKADTKPHRKIMATYCRIIDAENAGLTASQIETGLGRKVRKGWIYEAQEAARELVSGGYLELAKKGVYCRQRPGQK